MRRRPPCRYPTTVPNRSCSVSSPRRVGIARSVRGGATRPPSTPLLCCGKFGGLRNATPHYFTGDDFVTRGFTKLSHDDRSESLSNRRRFSVSPMNTCAFCLLVRRMAAEVCPSPARNGPGDRWRSRGRKGTHAASRTARERRGEQRAYRAVRRGGVADGFRRLLERFQFQPIGARGQHG